MGLLTEGTPLNWNDSKPYLNLIKKRGIQQFISLYKNNLHREQDPLTWGDEIEYLIIEMDSENKLAYLSTCAHKLLPKLNKSVKVNNCELNSCWCSEYAKFMLEAEPKEPYSDKLSDLIEVEKNMNQRREGVRPLLDNKQSLITLSNFISLGSESIKNLDFKAETDQMESNKVTKSAQISDKVIYPHPRYSTLTQNLRLKKGAKLSFKISLYNDTNTKSSNIDQLDPKTLILDSVSYAASCCCLQITLQCPSFEEATFVYDSLIPISPIMLALSANTPIMKGFLTTLDTRFPCLKSLINDTTLGENKQKDRYDSSSIYIGKNEYYKPQFNDVELTEDSSIKPDLIQAGITPNLISHLASIFNYDPILIFEENIKEFNPEDSNHFENIQTSVWQTVRFKPPSADNKIGWRVEFRPMEVQLTDFENAAYAVFINLLVRAILKLRPNFYMNISNVNENIDLASKIDATNTQLFSFPNNQNELELFSINQLINGDNSIEGLIPLIQRYLKLEKIRRDIINKIQCYIQFIGDRASGKLISGATFLRQNILNHPNYLKDSKLNDSINYDLICLIDNLGKCQYHLAPQLLGQYHRFDCELTV